MFTMPNLLDKDLDVEKVFLLLGHCSTATTESAYGRKKETVAISDALEITKESVDSEAVQDP